MQLTWLTGAPIRPASAHRLAVGQGGLGSSATQLMRAVRAHLWYDLGRKFMERSPWTKIGIMTLNSITAELASRYRQNQEILLELIDDLTDEQIAWAPNGTTPCVGFHVWHMARWADYLQELFNGKGSQIWEAEGLADRWNMATQSLGYAQTGMEMDQASAKALQLPAKAILLDYVRRAFAAAQEAVRGLRDEEFFAVHECFHGENWHGGQIGPIVVTWMTHDNRHLGMIEGLIGLLGKAGSADA